MTAEASTNLTLLQVRNELREVTTEWYSLGLQLGIKPYELKQIEESHRHDADRCKTDTLDYWLRNSDDPSWKALAKALDKIGGHALLAEALRAKVADPASEGPQNGASNANGGNGTHEASYASVSPDAIHDLRPRSLSHQNGNIENVYDTCKAKKPVVKCLENEFDESDLKVETTKMMLDFGVLVTAVQRTLQDKGVTPEEFASHLQKIKALEPVSTYPDTPLLQDCIAEVRVQKNLGDAFEVISGYYSWFNHLLILNIIEAFCEDDRTIAQKLDKFLDQFRKYCENRISKVPKNGFGFGRKRDVSAIRFKVDEEWRIARVSQIAFIKNTVATILKVKRHTIYLCSVDNGCVEITLLLPKLVAETVFPLSHNKEVALGEMGVLELQCGSYLFAKSSDAHKTSPKMIDLKDVRVFGILTTSGFKRTENGHTHEEQACQNTDHGSLEPEEHIQYLQQSLMDAQAELQKAKAHIYVLQHKVGEGEHITKLGSHSELDPTSVPETVPTKLKASDDNKQQTESGASEGDETESGASEGDEPVLKLVPEFPSPGQFQTGDGDSGFGEPLRKLPFHLKGLYEELKRTKAYLQEEIYHLKAYKKTCSQLKAENAAIKLKNEQLQLTIWRLMDEKQQLNVEIMGKDNELSLLSRRPGDGKSGEASDRSEYSSELGFQRRTQLRQTYHFGGVSRYPSSHSQPHKGNRAEMEQTSSAVHVLEPDKDRAKKEDYAYSYSTAKSHRSGTSDTVVEDIVFPMVCTTPHEQNLVYVMGEDVSKSVLPEGLPKDKELAMIYALQNCNTVQELIKCLISYGVSTSANKLEGFRVESEQLKSSIEHLRSKNTTLVNLFESTKSNMESMYYHVQVVEANNVRLQHALRLCQQACEVFEVLLELRVSDSQPSSSNPNYFPSFPEVYNTLESSTRSPDHEQVSMKHSVVYKVRSLLHSLDANTELQTYHPGVRTRHGSADYQQTSHWAGSSQNTGTTSGLSSMSGGLDGEVTPNEVERLKMYTQALLLYRNHLVGTLVPVDGLTGLDTVKKGVQETDCTTTAERTGQIIDLEDAANAEELCKIREEKAELRSQIYIMEQEKRRMELEVSRMLLHKQRCDKVLKELQFQLEEEKRERKEERKGRRGDAAIPPHDALHMSELSIEHQSALEREKELAKRYEDLFNFLQMHVKDSQCTSEELMRFVKELRRANSALVDAFEKSKKRQQAEKKRMKQELVSYMNRVQNFSTPTSDDPQQPPSMHKRSPRTLQ